MGESVRYDSAIILGAGAVGSFLGARLAGVLPTTLVGRSAHVDTINRAGLRLTGELDETVSVDAATDLPDIPPRALVVVTVKLGGIPETTKGLAARARDDTTVLVTQNGLDPDRRMREELARRGRGSVPLQVRPNGGRGAVLVVRALTSSGCNLVRPGEVEYWGGGLTFPESGGVAPVADLFRRAGIEVTVESDFERAVWAKFAVNCVANPLSAILNVRNRGVTAPELAGLRLAILDEVRAAAQDSGVTLPEEIGETLDRALAASGNRNSMLQDIAYGRPTEIGELNERGVAMATAAGRGAPANATVSRLVRFLETRSRSGRGGA